MKYQNGHFRNDSDSTLWLRPESQKQKLTWEEYLPVVVLCVFFVSLLVNGLLR